jgi:hypothetical protein
MGVRLTVLSAFATLAPLHINNVSCKDEMTMAKEKKVGVCALCGKTLQITREHVPPKNLYLPPRPKNTITVPVCEPCNHGYHLDDEYFRVYVAAGARPGTRLWRLWKEKVVGSSFVRGGGLKGRLNDDQDKVVHHHHMVEPLRTVEGKILDDKWLPLVASFSAPRIIAVVDKIVRCLHFSLYGTPLPTDTHFDVDTTPLSPTDSRLLYTQPTGKVGDFEEFVFRREGTEKSGSCWLMAFYGLHTFTVKVQEPANPAMQPIAKRSG